jgi:hypothetical protein
MPSFFVNDIDIDVDEFIDRCSTNEIKELINILVKGGYINIPIDHKERGYDSNRFIESIEKLKYNRHRLSNEEEKLINSIADKL